MLSRREVLHATGATAAALALPTLSAVAQAPDKKPAAAGFKLNPLPYAFDALEPVIDAVTMETHHDKHQAAYVKALNDYLGGSSPEWLKKTVEEVIRSVNTLPEASRQAVRNNGGGVWNHEFFWSVMASPGKGGGGAPKGELLAAIDASFNGGLDTLKKGMIGSATARFGSGWVWLVPGKEKPLELVSTPNQDNPIMEGGAKPILGVDVWEHAYYLKYKNLRAKYVEEWFKVVNWDQVAANLAATKKA